MLQFGQYLTINLDEACTRIGIIGTNVTYVVLQSAGRNVDEMLGAGSSILEGLRDQGSLLKSAHKRVLDLTSTLGMSNTIMRLVERRGQQDKYILIAGMFLVLLLLYLILRYF